MKKQTSLLNQQDAIQNKQVEYLGRARGLRWQQRDLRDTAVLLGATPRSLPLVPVNSVINMRMNIMTLIEYTSNIE